MIQRLQQMSGREWVLATAIMLLAIGFVAGRVWILPAYDRWSAARAQLEARQLEHTKLSGFMEVRQEVDQAYTDLGPQVFQNETDQITLSRFLRRLEEIARLPSMTIVNAKPQTVEQQGTVRFFPIRLTVSGTLPEVTRFATDLAEGPDVVSLDGYSLRGVQGGRLVECSLSIRLITLSSSRSSRSDGTGDEAATEPLVRRPEHG